MRSKFARAASLVLGMALATASPVLADEAPKRGGTLTYMIPADAPPSFDGHREATYATIHAMAPFYSVLIRINPENPSSTTDFVCDLCTEIPKPTDDGKTYTFKIRDGVKFTDGTPLTAADVAASWQEIIAPPQGVTSARQAFYVMVDKVEATDPSTVVFHLKFATTTFLPALADPFAFIYEKAILDDPARGPHWYEKNVMGSGPFKFVSYEAGQSIKGERNPDYYHKGLPYLDGFVGIYAPKLATRVDAIRSDNAAMEFRSEPPSARDQLVKELGDKITVQESDWNCGNLLTYNSRKKPFDDPRVRRALSLAIDQWKGGPALSKIAIVRTVAGIVFPGSPLAATKDELQQLAGFWPDIEKSRAEAKRLLHEAGADNLTFELLNRDVDQPFKYVGTFVVDEWSKIGVHVTQKVVPTGPWFENMRAGTFDVTMEANCQSVVNPVLDVSKYLPHTVFTENYGGYEDQDEIDLYQKMLHETDPAKQRALMRDFEKYVIDTKAYELPITFWYRIVPYRSYVKGWKISPSHFLNQDLATIWLDK
ncbi:MAG TPA: ABC transporter substrate-binding protein [Stellaceae bacterium]|nr:ABC transporter substrate-binding protein [Stellaceae bacterium]